MDASGVYTQSNANARARGEQALPSAAGALIPCEPMSPLFASLGKARARALREPARLGILVSSLLLAGMTAACDSPGASKEPAGQASSKAITAPAPTATPAATPAATPTTAASAAAPPKKKQVDCPKEKVVTFHDQTLETVVRRQLRKESGPIERSELAKVKTLDLSQAPSNDELDPCIFPAFTGLKGLYLAPGKLDDLSPIKGLTQIESLRASATLIKDLTPLSGLTKLDRLDIGRTPVSDLAPLASLVNLTEIQIDDTEVTDLTPLASLKKLNVVLLKRTRVSDVSPLKGLRELKHVYIEGSLVKDTTPLLGIPNLKIHE